MLSNSHYYIIPTTGNTINIPNWCDKLLINPAGTLLALTINMPPNPAPGQKLKIYSTQIITGVTHGGGTLLGSLTTLAANVLGGSWAFCSETQTWYQD